MRVCWVIAFTLMMGVATPVTAQTADSTRMPAATGVAERGDVPSINERLAVAPAAARLLAAQPVTKTALDETPAVMRRQSRGRGTALAIVGGALFVGGLVAGGDAGTAMVVVGAGIGAWGLYLMLTP